MKKLEKPKNKPRENNYKVKSEINKLGNIKQWNSLTISKCSPFGGGGNSTIQWLNG